MRRTHRFALAAAPLLLALAPAAFGWSALGHRLTGELAERHLDPVASAEVARLLAGEDDPSLSGVAYWADALRNADPPRFKQTSSWHYVNYPRDRCEYARRPGSAAASTGDFGAPAQAGEVLLDRAVGSKDGKGGGQHGCSGGWAT